jgi:hypothetical protein
MTAVIMPPMRNEIVRGASSPYVNVAVQET